MVQMRTWGNPIPSRVVACRIVACCMALGLGCSSAVEGTGTFSSAASGVTGAAAGTTEGAPSAAADPGAPTGGQAPSGVSPSGVSPGGVSPGSVSPGGVGTSGAGSGLGMPDDIGASSPDGGSGGGSAVVARTETGYLDLRPPLGAPFEPDGATALMPPAPPGWGWYPVPGSRCRDGSEAGLFIRFEDSKRLVIYFEGGGACTSPGFCNFNPQSVNHVLSGTGETVLGSALGATVGRQQPGVYQNGELSGIFGTDRPENPFRDWNMVYVPYCTGDVHAGTRDDASVPGVAEPQHFVGHRNTGLFVGRLAATFAAGLEHVVVTGSSAGSFGAALELSTISDAFASVQVDALLDSGAPFDDAHWPPCLQRSWRELFGLDAALPPDCSQCFAADGGGLLGLADFLLEKHPTLRIALVSSTEDEVIRLFFTPGENGCASADTADPVQITLGQLGGQTLYPAQRYGEGLLALRARFADTGRLSTYFFAGASATLHQHTWRPRFFEALAGATTLAQFVGDFVAGRSAQVGP